MSLPLASSRSLFAGLKPLRTVHDIGKNCLKLAITASTSSYGSRHYSPLAGGSNERPYGQYRRNRVAKPATSIFGAPTPPHSSAGYGEPIDLAEGSLITHTDPIASLLAQPTIVIERQLEMINVIFGFEQANRYVIMDAAGNVIGYMYEEDFGFTKAILRQIYRLHRPFRVRVTDVYDNHLLTISRNFSLINSHIKTILPIQASGYPVDGLVIGESVQSWHLWRRRYNLFYATSTDPGNEVFDQFGKIDAPFLSFSFPVQNELGQVMASVDRNWVGLGREFFTDTGVYVIRMDPQQSFAGMEDQYDLGQGFVPPNETMNYDKRAVMLATAVSVDFDYFSRHSGRGGFFMFGGDE